MDFADAIARMRDVELIYTDAGDERVHIAPPASAEQRRLIEARLGGPIPGELDRLLAVTARYAGNHPSLGNAQLDFAASDEDSVFADGFRDARDLGLGDLFQVYDYGNGDGLYLEPGEPSCRPWWFGHDPWICTLVARSLADYVARSAAFFTAAMAYDRDEGDGAKSPYEPVHTLEPTTLRRERDPAIRAFVDAHPGARVYDFRGATPPTTMDFDVGGGLRRSGEIVLVLAR